MHEGGAGPISVTQEVFLSNVRTNGRHLLQMNQ